MTATSTSFQTIKRDLVLAADPRSIRTFQDKPTPRYVPPRPRLRPPGRPQPRSSAIALVESATSRHKVPHPFQRTIATTDGEIIRAVRYPSERKSRSIFYTTDVPTLRKLYPARPELPEFSDDARLIVSEPLGDIAGRRGRDARVLLRHCRARARRGATVSDPERRRYRCLSPEAPPAHGELPLPARSCVSRHRSCGRKRPVAFSNRSAVECHPLRWASITRVNNARGRSHSGRRV